MTWSRSGHPDWFEVLQGHIEVGGFSIKSPPLATVATVLRGLATIDTLNMSINVQYSKHHT